MNKRIKMISNKIKNGMKLNKSDLLYLNRQIRNDKELESNLKKNQSLYLRVLKVDKNLKELELKTNQQNSKFQYLNRKEFKNGTNSFKYSIEINTDKYYRNDEIEPLTEPFDDGYLFYLSDKLGLSVINSNDYLTSVFNILTDRNYLINHIGIKINILKENL